LDCGWSHGYALRHELVGVAHPASAAARSARGRSLPLFRGKSGKLIKIFWYDGLGASLYVKRLEKGRFIWPATHDGVVVITPGQLGYLLEGIDWRHPQHTWRPEIAG
jgi:transposase